MPGGAVKSGWPGGHRFAQELIARKIRWRPQRSAGGLPLTGEGFSPNTLGECIGPAGDRFRPQQGHRLIG